MTFGDNVFIAPNCGFYTAGHPLDYPTRNALLEFGQAHSTVGDTCGSEATWWCCLV